MIMQAPQWLIVLKLNSNEKVEFVTYDSEDYTKIVAALDDYRRSYNQRKRNLALNDLNGNRVEVDLDQIEWVSIQSAV